MELRLTKHGHGKPQASTAFHPQHPGCIRKSTSTEANSVPTHRTLLPPCPAEGPFKTMLAAFFLSLVNTISALLYLGRCKRSLHAPPSSHTHTRTRKHTHTHREMAIDLCLLHSNRGVLIFRKIKKEHRPPFEVVIHGRRPNQASDLHVRARLAFSSRKSKSQQKTV